MHAHPRVQRRVRVLEDDLHPAPERRGAPPAERPSTSTPSNRMRARRSGRGAAGPAGRWWTSRSPTPPPGRASRPRSTREADVVDRVHDALVAAAEVAGPDREVLHEVGRPRGARASLTSARLLARRAPRARARRGSTPSGAAVASSTASSGGRSCAHGRSAYGQRGANAHPSAGADRSAVSRRSCAAVHLGRRRGAAASRADRSCTGGAGGRRCRRAIPPRRCRPAYITSTRSATPATTPRSWVISSIADVGRSWMPLEHVEHLRLDRHVERRRRLVGDQQRRLVRDRHRDHRPLPHAAGELVRVLVARALAGLRDADDLEQLDAACRRAASFVGEVCCSSASAIWSPTRNTGFSDDERVLEDHRELAAAQAAGTRVSDSPRSERPVEQRCRRRRSSRLGDQPHDRQRA